MEFDKEKILSAIQVDRVKIGDKGFFGDSLAEVEHNYNMHNVLEITDLDTDDDEHLAFEGNYVYYNFFLPYEEDITIEVHDFFGSILGTLAGELIKTMRACESKTPKSYAEQQAEWVKNNNIHIGSKVRVNGEFEDNAYGSYTVRWNYAEQKGALQGKICVVTGINERNIVLDIFSFPFQVLTPVADQDAYLEEQAEWIKKNNVKNGTRCKVLRSAESHERGWDSEWTGEHKCSGTVVICDTLVNLMENGIFMDDGCCYPFFVLEVVKETDEERYVREQNEWLEKNNVKKGTLLRIKRKATDYENGWGSGWGQEMNELVGCVLPFEQVHERASFGEGKDIPNDYF